MSSQPAPIPKKSDVPEGVWDRCQSCGEMLYTREFEEALCVCPSCGHHHRLDARTRVRQLCDEGAFEEFQRLARKHENACFAVVTGPLAFAALRCNLENAAYNLFWKMATDKPVKYLVNVDQNKALLTP